MLGGNVCSVERRMVCGEVGNWIGLCKGGGLVVDGVIWWVNMFWEGYWFNGCWWKLKFWKGVESVG